MNIENLLTQKELAEFLQVTTVTLWKWREKGMPHIKTGRHIKYDKEKVLRWLEEQKEQN